MRKNITAIANALCISLLAPVAVQAQAQQLLYYNFNSPLANKQIVDNSGNNHTGRIAGADANFSQNRAGVSGNAGDYAFYNQNTTMGGSGGNAGYVDGSLSGLTSFTITMWFKTNGNTDLGSSARLFDITGDNQVLLAGVGAGNVNVFAGSSDLTRTAANPILSATDEWVFVAVSYSYSGSVGTWSIYAGSDSRSDSVELVGARSSGNISGPLDFENIYFGSTANGSRAFNGWLDDIRIYGAASGSTGALTKEELDVIRLEALNQIPESSSTVLWIGAAALSMLALQRIRRRQRAA